MDKQTDHKKNIAITTIALLLFFVDAYMALISNSGLYDMLGFIQNQLARDAAMWIIQYLFMGFSASVVYAAINFLYRLTWRMKNKHIWYDGTWLHIHEKGNIKIGVVSIRQNFFDLEIHGTNIPINASDPGEKKTAWYYIGSMIEPSGSLQDELIGCYIANRSKEKNKYGVHIFHRVERAGGKPVRLKGVFGDILSDSATDTKELSDKMGNLYLFRLPGSIRKYIKYNGRDDKDFDFSRLSNILDDNNLSVMGTEKAAEIRQTEFYKKLSSIVSRQETPV